MSRKLPAPTRDPATIVDAVLALARDKVEDREMRLLGVRAEMVMPDERGPGRAHARPRPDLDPSTMRESRPNS